MAEDKSPASGDAAEFLRDKHAKFFARCLTMLPTDAQGLDASRTTLVYFCVAGLDMLNALEPLVEKGKLKPDSIVDWVYSMQVKLDAKADQPTARLGFRGAPDLGSPYCPGDGGTPRCCRPDTGSLAHTYTAMLTLAILGDDFSRLEKEAIAQTLGSYQLDDGSFVSNPDGGESDMRYVYCACCIAYMLNDWSGVDMDGVARFIRDSLCYDSGIAQAPDLESHAGSCLCALASLKLMVSGGCFAAADVFVPPSPSLWPYQCLAVCFAATARVVCVDSGSRRGNRVVCRTLCRRRNAIDLCCGSLPGRKLALAADPTRRWTHATHTGLEHRWKSSAHTSLSTCQSFDSTS